MRHDNIQPSREVTDSQVAAAWPQLQGAIAPPQQAGPEPAPAHPAAAAPDVPVAVGRLVVAAYGGLLLVFFALFARSPLALFSIGICAFFMAMFFAVPAVFLKVEGDPARRPTLARFMRDGMDVLTGHSTGRDALIQMLMVPVLLTFGLAAMGVVGLALVQ